VTVIRRIGGFIGSYFNRRLNPNLDFRSSTDSMRGRRPSRNAQAGTGRADPTENILYPDVSMAVTRLIPDGRENEPPLCDWITKEGFQLVPHLKLPGVQVEIKPRYGIEFDSPEHEARAYSTPVALPIDKLDLVSPHLTRYHRIQRKILLARLVLRCRTP
jgi:hypothetical protein